MVAPLVAACGVRVPMLSGRGLGHTGGTLDKLEAIPGMNVFLSPDKVPAGTGRTGMVICGQTDNIVPADKKLYALRDATATVSCIPLIASSIMSKKLALGTDGIVLDVKTGSGAFMRDEQDSIRLCRTMVAHRRKDRPPHCGHHLQHGPAPGPRRGQQPGDGRVDRDAEGQGPGGRHGGHLALGWCMLRAAGKERLRPRRWRCSARPSPRAGPWRYSGASSPPRGATRGSATIIPCCPRRRKRSNPGPGLGYIARIDAFAVGMAAIDTGAGRRKKEDAIAYGSGFVFHANVGDKVEKGQKLVTVHSDRPEQATAVLERLAPGDPDRARGPWPSRKWSCTWWTRTASAPGRTDDRGNEIQGHLFRRRRHPVRLSRGRARRPAGLPPRIPDPARAWKNSSPPTAATTTMSGRNSSAGETDQGGCASSASAAWRPNSGSGLSLERISAFYLEALADQPQLLPGALELVRVWPRGTPWRW